MDFEGLIKLTQKGPGMALATRDAELRPELIDGLGTAVAPDGRTMVVYVAAAEAAQTFVNLENNGHLALSIARPCDYFAAQIKGRLRARRSMTTEEQGASAQWAERYRDELRLISVPSSVIRGLRMVADTALEVDINELYVQTPGPAAGNPLEVE